MGGVTENQEARSCVDSRAVFLFFSPLSSRCHSLVLRQTGSAFKNMMDYKIKIRLYLYAFELIKLTRFFFKDKVYVMYG